jgi:8-hydroxy-5-deazaflavin:NADPH oxidoreductase
MSGLAMIRLSAGFRYSEYCSTVGRARRHIADDVEPQSTGKEVGKVRVAFVGAGRMGQALGRLFAEAGHEVVLSNSRGPASLADIVAEVGPNASAASVADAVADADVVVVATPWWKTAEAVSAISDWSGKILVDTTNNRKGPGPEGVIDIGDRASSEVVADLVPGARVVKAFNYTGIPLMAEALGRQPAAANAILIAGDDEDAKTTVAELIASIGGEAVDTGSLASGGRLQGTTGPLSGHMRMFTPDEARSLLAEARLNA